MCKYPWYGYDEGPCPSLQSSVNHAPDMRHIIESKSNQLQSLYLVKQNTQIK